MNEQWRCELCGMHTRGVTKGGIVSCQFCGAPGPNAEIPQTPLGNSSTSEAELKVRFERLWEQDLGEQTLSRCEQRLSRAEEIAKQEGASAEELTVLYLMFRDLYKQGTAETVVARRIQTIAQAKGALIDKP